MSLPGGVWHPDNLVPRFKYFDWFVNAYVAVLLISNIVAPKLIAIGDFWLSAAQALFPITYIFGDIFTEVYGYAASRRAIWAGFGAAALLALISSLVIALPPAPDWGNQVAYETVLGMVPRLVVASLIAYWCGEFANSFVMAKMKVATQGKHLWMRTIGSTAVGQLADSVIVMVVAFGGTMPWATIVNLIISGYLFKVAYEALMTPVTYLVVNWLKRAEGVDAFDSGTDFNPFHATAKEES
jgi:queuosine precursor transporter